MTRRPSAENALVWSLLLGLGAGIVYPLLQVLSVAVMMAGRPRRRSWSDLAERK